MADVLYICFPWGEIASPNDDEGHPYCPKSEEADIGTKVAEQDRDHSRCGWYSCKRVTHA